MVCETCIDVDETQEAHVAKVQKFKTSKIQRHTRNMLKKVACDANKWSSNNLDAVMEKQATVAVSHIKPNPRAKNQTIQDKTIENVGAIEGK